MTAATPAAQIWALAVQDHDGDHVQYVFTDPDVAQQVADAQNPRRSRHYQLALIEFDLITSADDPRVTEVPRYEAGALDSLRPGESL